MLIIDKILKKNSSRILPDDMEKLLEIVLKDGVVDERARRVLHAKAEKHGIMPEELDMIIDYRVKAIEEEKDKVEENKKANNVVDKNTFDKILSENKYSRNDTVDVMFGKYEALCDLSDMELDKRQKEKVHNARITFAAELPVPQDVDEALSLVSRALPYAKKPVGSEVVRTLTSIGFGAINTVSTVGKIASFGVLSKSINQVENIAKKVITSDDYELACAWQSKLQQIIADVKNKLKFFGDKELKSIVSELEKQIK